MCFEFNDLLDFAFFGIKILIWIVIISIAIGIVGACVLVILKKFKMQSEIDYLSRIGEKIDFQKNWPWGARSFNIYNIVIILTFSVFAALAVMEFFWLSNQIMDSTYNLLSVDTSCSAGYEIFGSENKIAECLDWCCAMQVKGWKAKLILDGVFILGFAGWFLPCWVMFTLAITKIFKKTHS